MQLTPAILKVTIHCPILQTLRVLTRAQAQRAAQTKVWLSAQRTDVFDSNNGRERPSIHKILQQVDEAFAATGAGEKKDGEDKKQSKLDVGQTSMCRNLRGIGDWSDSVTVQGWDSDVKRSGRT